MDDELIWKRRFLMFMGARLFGIAVFLAGVFIAFTDIAREGGMPVLGAVLAVLGAIDAVFAPRMLKKLWEQEDSAADQRDNPTDLR